MEAYKGNTLVSIFRRMEILSDFPKQVVVLKTTGVVCGLRGRQAGLQRRLIDEDQTSGFPIYCDRLRAAKLGDPVARQQLLENGREADAQMERMHADVAMMPDAIDLIVKGFTADELKTIRTAAVFSDQLVGKVLRFIDLAQNLYSRHPRATFVPSIAELPNTFLFRMALCAFVWMLDWIELGGYRGAKTAKLRNDLVDVNFATFATYFDGLMSEDDKPRRIYRRAALILDAITGSTGERQATLARI